MKRDPLVDEINRHERRVERKIRVHLMLLFLTGIILGVVFARACP